MRAEQEALAEFGELAVSGDDFVAFAEGSDVAGEGLVGLFDERGREGA